MYSGGPEKVAEKAFSDGERIMARFWLIDPRINGNGWRTPAETIMRCAQSFVGKPLIHYFHCWLGRCEAHHITAGPGRPCLHSLELQEPYRVGNITRVEVTSEAKAHAIVNITDASTRERVDTGEPLFVSPAVCPTPNTVSYEGASPWGAPIRVLHDWEGIHLALVEKPAYGPDAKLLGKCKGADCDPVSGPISDFATLRSGELPSLRGPVEARALGQVSMVRDIDRDGIPAAVGAEDLMKRARGI